MAGLFVDSPEAGPAGFRLRDEAVYVFILSFQHSCACRLSIGWICRKEKVVVEQK